MKSLEEHHRILEEVQKDPLSDENLRKIKDNFHTEVFDDCHDTQIKGWGAANFLVHGKPTIFQIVAEFRGGSGSMFDRWYAGNALRTWHQLANEVLILRQEVARLREESDE